MVAQAVLSFYQVLPARVIALTLVLAVIAAT